MDEFSCKKHGSYDDSKYEFKVWFKDSYYGVDSYEIFYANSEHDVRESEDYKKLISYLKSENLEIGVITKHKTTWYKKQCLEAQKYSE